MVLTENRMAKVKPRNKHNYGKSLYANKEKTETRIVVYT